MGFDKTITNLKREIDVKKQKQKQVEKCKKCEYAKSFEYKIYCPFMNCIKG